MQIKHSILTSIGLLFKSESRSSTRSRCTLMRPIILSLNNERREFINVIIRIIHLDTMYNGIAVQFKMPKPEQAKWAVNEGKMSCIRINLVK